MDVLVAGVFTLLWGLALTFAIGYITIAREQLEDEERSKRLTK
jgi:hypothetical protein